ncbi:hypothetical protein [Lactobacillus gasseri]|uniref:CRISPR type III-B/RAMP module-associated protein Cmr5 n=1 Tax=Lactobacillus gasseri TaxID=1596 RepID=A0AB33CIX2_LACGS|nr:hypothetical protein [Lactobacillus gasseri]ART99186.1 hypothetical protein CCE30_09975 [Lactobacillus gasseri]RBQ00739.1 hypothetical protein C3745_07410 [Lactobacillus gasseri]
MDAKTNDVKNFFDEAVKIKEQRGKNYDNGGKSAFERSMDMYDEDNAIVVSTWPIVQKTSRLVTIAKELQQYKNNKNSELSLSSKTELIKAMDDTSKDLANYVAMQWVRNVKPYLSNGGKK